jgi:hypothetical protein
MFIKSHLRIRSLVGRPIQAAGINGTHPDLLQEFYQSYEEIVRQYDIEQPELVLDGPDQFRPRNWSSENW